MSKINSAHTWVMRGIAAVALFGAVACSRAVGIDDAGSAPAWPMLGGNAQRTWQSEYVGPQAGAEKRIVTVHALPGGNGAGSPIAVDGTGAIIMKSSQSLYSHEPGTDVATLVYEADDLERIFEPVLDRSNRLYFGTFGFFYTDDTERTLVDLVHAVGRDGESRWEYHHPYQDYQQWSVSPRSLAIG